MKVALALAVDAAIWALDADFLGCGIATWTTETLYLGAIAFLNSSNTNHSRLEKLQEHRQSLIIRNPSLE